MNENDNGPSNGFVTVALVTMVLIVGAFYRLPDFLVPSFEQFEVVYQANDRNQMRDDRQNRPCLADSRQAERLGPGWFVESEECAALRRADTSLSLVP